EAGPPRDRGEDGGGAAGAPPARVQAARAGGEELRGDRGDHGREPGDGEEPAAPGAHELLGADRAVAELGLGAADWTTGPVPKGAGPVFVPGGSGVRGRSRLQAACSYKDKRARARVRVRLRARVRI